MKEVCIYVWLILEMHLGAFLVLLASCVARGKGPRRADGVPMDGVVGNTLPELGLAWFLSACADLVPREPDITPGEPR